MPYNNTPISPTQDVSGSCALPLARVKKIIKADPDTGDCSNNAAFAIAIATEMFVQHLVERTQTVVRAEAQRGKSRRNIQYRDIATAVSKYDNLEFLSDVVPKTVLFKDYRNMRRSRTDAPPRDVDVLANGQRTLNWGAPPEHVANEQTFETVDRNHHINGVVAADTPTTSAVPARHSFDAVRNAYDAGPRPDVSMTED